ncbi:MAG: hypothetical protein M3P04_10565, partial [Actinomycetota bacterium]|nr:hypothetical protein [Actinomycetota bacterium]
FDRAPAEAICGIVAFHYNHFERSMTKTKSQRVADVSLRLEAMVNNKPWTVGDLSAMPHSSLDVALSDSVIEQVLQWCAIPLDGTAQTDVDGMLTSLPNQRPYDAIKLQLIAAEHLLAAGDTAAAANQAEDLRHSRLAEAWYADMRNRLEGA